MKLSSGVNLTILKNCVDIGSITLFNTIPFAGFDQQSVVR